MDDLCICFAGNERSNEKPCREPWDASRFGWRIELRMGGQGVYLKCFSLDGTGDLRTPKPLETAYGLRSLVGIVLSVYTRGCIFPPLPLNSALALVCRRAATPFRHHFLINTFGRDLGIRWNSLHNLICWGWVFTILRSLLVLPWMALDLRVHFSSIPSLFLLWKLQKQLYCSVKIFWNLMWKEIVFTACCLLVTCGLHVKFYFPSFKFLWLFLLFSFCITSPLYAASCSAALRVAEFVWSCMNLTLHLDQSNQRFFLYRIWVYTNHP